MWGFSYGSVSNSCITQPLKKEASVHDSHSCKPYSSPRCLFLPDEVYNLQVNYARAEDYPVDLYYLMDLSKSMEDDKNKLSSLGAEIAREMRGITSNFRLGFGSFVDKVLMPYVSTVPKK